MATDAWVDRLKLYKTERGILRFVDEEFKVQLDKWQEQALLLYESPKREHRRISLQACAGPGKSAVLAWCGWWFLSCLGEEGEHPKGAVTAITSDNLHDNVWAEFAKWQGISPYLSSQFTWSARRIHANDHPETWFLSARSWPKSASADEQGKTLSGLHSKYVTALIDESGAIPTTVLRAGEQALSRCAFGKLLQAGNPISLEGMLYAAATQLRHQWVIVKITGDPDDPHAWVHSPRVGDEPKKWAQEQIDTYTRDNPWVKAYILGQFPPSSINTLLGIEDVEASMARKYRPEEYNWQQKRIGADIARFGDDRSVLFPRQGLVAFKPKVMRNARTSDIAARLANIYHKWGEGDALIIIDDTGHWGHGVVDQLSVARIEHMPVVYHAKAILPQYKNRRAEMWFQGAEWVKRGGKLPYVPELVAELTTPTYTMQQGQILLEPKELVKERLGRSPDLADALMQTFAIEDMAKEIGARHRRHRVRTQDDPEGTGRALTLDDQ